MARFANVYSTGSSSLQRSLIAFLIVPFLSGIFVVSAMVLFLMLRMPAGETTPDLSQVLLGFVIAVFFGALLIGLPFAYIGMVAVGIPTWLLLRFTNNESGLAYNLFGAVGGWWLVPLLGGHKWAAVPLDILGACSGGIALFLFWRIARERGPLQRVKD